MKSKETSIKELRKIPGVGKVVAQDLLNLGFQSISDLKGQNPEEMYIHHNEIKGSVQDICMLYTFRCAVYFAETPQTKQELEKLKWWNWMDKEKISSEEKDFQIKQWLRKGKKTK
ncbi:MAG: pathogenicity locus [Leptospiraceae bacterium]|nr:pathogenicity locus [Leptospiraceae bacterium]MBK9498948.1 pathogenicity locus [Leptospiraceae bacterium]